jgi:hypothetical protein
MAEGTRGVPVRPAPGRTMTVLEGAGDPVELAADETGCGVFLSVKGRSECQIWFAVHGLADKFNTGGAVRGLRAGEDCTRFRIADGGEVVFYAARGPADVSFDGAPVPWEHDAVSGRGAVRAPRTGELVIIWR